LKIRQCSVRKRNIFSIFKNTGDDIIEVISVGLKEEHRLQRVWVALGCGLNDRVSILVKGTKRILSLLQLVSNWFWNPASFLTDDKNEWSYTSTAPGRLLSTGIILCYHIP